MRTKIAEHSKETFLSELSDIHACFTGTLQVNTTSMSPETNLPDSFILTPSIPHCLLPLDCWGSSQSLLPLIADMKLSSRKTGVTGKTFIFESHKPIQIFPSSSTSSVNELLCDTSWVQPPITWGEEPPSAQERPLGAGRQEELLSLRATARLQRLQFHLAL